MPEALCLRTTKMTGTSEVEARPTSVSSQENAEEPASGAPQQPQNFGKRTEGQARDTGNQVWSIAEKARDELAKNIEPAKRTAKHFAEDQKEAGARKIGDVAHAVQVAASQLQPELPQVAKSIHDAASALEQAAVRLGERSVDDLIGSCAKFARTQPAAFFGAATLAGFLAARFLKSSAEPAGDDAKG